MLVDLLPETVTAKGVEYPINTDFRTSILFEMLMQDPHLQVEDKTLRALNLYYPDIPHDLSGACEELIWFYMCGKRMESGQTEGEGEGGSVKRVYDFEYDDGYIYAAFLEQYHIDLQEVKYLHWWKFRAMFRALKEDCEFVKIMGYRSMKIPAKMPKEQKAFYRKMKRIHALPLPQNEQEKVDAITQALMDGGDLSSLI